MTRPLLSLPLLILAPPSLSPVVDAAPLPSASAYRERHAAAASHRAQGQVDDDESSRHAARETHRSLWDDWPEPVCLADQEGTSVNATYGDSEDEYTPAECGVHCRHFHAEPASSDECPGGGFYLDFLLGGDGRRHVHVTSCREDEKLDFTLDTADGDHGPEYLTDAEREFMIKTADRIEADHDDLMDNVDALALHAVRAARILSEWPEGLEIAYVLNPEEQRDNQRDYEVEVPERFFDDPPGTRLRRLSGARAAPRVLGDGRKLDHDELFTDMCHEVYQFLHPIGYSSDTFSAQIGPLPWCLNATGHKGMQIYDWTQDDETDEDRWSCQSREDLEDGCCYPPRIDFALGDCFGRCGSHCGNGNTLGSYTLDCADYDFCRLFRVWTDQMDDDGDGEAESTCHHRFLNALDDWMWSYHCDPEHLCPIDPWSCEYERTTLYDLFPLFGQWDAEEGDDVSPITRRMPPAAATTAATTTTTTSTSTDVHEMAPRHTQT